MWKRGQQTQHQKRTKVRLLWTGESKVFFTQECLFIEGQTVKRGGGAFLQMLLGVWSVLMMSITNSYPICHQGDNISVVKTQHK